MKTVTAAYCRVSTASQNEAGQIREIERWHNSHSIGDVRWFIDKRSGDNLVRPAFEKLQQAVFAGEVNTVLVYKLDRISRNLVDGINVLVAWCKAGIRVVSVTQQLDFGGSTGQLVASVLFAVAQMEQEARRERQAAGIAAAKATGRRWGGSKPGRRISVSKEQVAMARRLRTTEPQMAISDIALATGMSRRTAYRLLAPSQQARS